MHYNQTFTVEECNCGFQEIHKYNNIYIKKQKTIHLQITSLWISGTVRNA